jgi:hypothetical protein
MLPLERMRILLIFTMLKHENVSFLSFLNDRFNKRNEIKVLESAKQIHPTSHISIGIVMVSEEETLNNRIVISFSLGKLIMTNSGAKEQLFYEAPRGTRITSIKTTDIEQMDWASWTGVLGLVCEGIWPPATDITDVNSTDLSKDKRILATGDDFGLVKLFEFPVKVNHRMK